MGNCLDSSSQTSHTPPASGLSKIPSNTNRSSAPSSSEQSKYDLGIRSEGEILAESNLKAFTYNELKHATTNFRVDCIIGEGDFTCIFKGWIDEHTHAAMKPGSAMDVAVKKLNPKSFRGHIEWFTKVSCLGQLDHPNLIKPIGYSSNGENRLLVYEFMANRDLFYQLLRRGATPLSWALRIKVAVGAARGLLFLHESKSHIVYRRFESSKILLDADFNAKLCDFGLAEEDLSRDRTLDGIDGPIEITDTVYYVAPEYISTGQLTTKSDVYSFGVVLLELLSGRRASKRSKVDPGEYTVQWATPYLCDEASFSHIMDPNLKGKYSEKCAYMAANLVSRCLNFDDKLRPDMAYVLLVLEQIQDLESVPKITSAKM